MTYQRKVICLVVLFLLSSLLSACAPGQKSPETTPTGSELITYHVAGGIAGYCHRLTIFKDGRAVLENECDKTSKDIQIEADKLEQIRSLADTIGGYTYTNAPSKGADSMAVEFQTFGAEKNNQKPDDKTVADLLALMSEITSRATLEK